MRLEARRPRTPSLTRLCAFGEDNVHSVARITVAALPVGVDLLPKVLEDVPRSALSSLTELDHRAQLLLVHRAALFVVLQVGAQIHGAQVLSEALPLSAAVLPHQAVSLEECENNLCFARRNSRQLHDVLQKHRSLEWVLLHRDRYLRGFLHLRILAAEEIRLNSLVLYAI